MLSNGFIYDAINEYSDFPVRHKILKVTKSMVL
jgi:hypothetical protein